MPKQVLLIKKPFMPWDFTENKNAAGNRSFLFYPIKTREFLQGAEQEGVVQSACEDIPRSFVVCDHPYHRQIVYISQLNTQTLLKRAEKK